MKKVINLVLIALIIGVTSQKALAQNASIPNVMDIKNRRQSGAILEENKLVGYYVFYFKEKQDKKNNAYEIEIFDDNYNSVKSFEMIRPKGSYLLEMVYNGKVFMMFFYDRKEGYEFVTFDKTGQEVGKLLVPAKEIPRYDVSRSAQALSSQTENVTIYPFGEEGFVRQSYSENKKLGYSLTAYDNSLKEKWKLESDPAATKIQTIEINQVNDQFITATVYKKKSLTTRKMDLAFVIINSANGKLIKEIPMGNEDEGKETVLRTYLDKEDSKIILIGEYYKPGDDFLKDKSQGIIVKEVSYSGDVLGTQQYGWDSEVAQFKNDNLDEEDKKEAKDGFSIFFHDVIRSNSNGHLFLVGEQFRKQVSAGGVAMNVVSGALGGGQAAANFEIRISNMIIIELDDKKEMVDFKIVKKKRTSVFLDPGMGLYGSAFLGYYINARGAFDYSFTSRQVEKDEFTVVYTDYDRKESKGDKKNDVMLGVLHFSGGEMEASRVPINTEAKNMWISPAKPGHVSISEYYKKEKRLDMRLEKLTY
ncbi:hypothetical protein K6119_08910 [Paracrocinitomix mangrovi]|uniref:DUF6770 family protein n=1 Tax=Paracrocinitomix mangrovi TaxID=2862509 RepID=UPI001C8E1919|nr:DUF6770 family protein [Paracrocinitomix mangrovi]UKN03631.1 hypothetical protein K6119_08910 [Paracrocinitomix mangrovi]